MYKMDKKLKKEMSGKDYYSSFIKETIKSLKTDRVCYVYHKEQIEELKKYINIPIKIIENGCGYTIRISKKYKEELENE